MQTKFRNGREIHEVRRVYHDHLETACSRATYDRFRHGLTAKVTCIQCLDQIEKKEREHDHRT